MDRLENVLKTRFKNETDFKIIGNKIYSKVAISYKTLRIIDEVAKVKAVFYLSKDTRPYNLGYRLGIMINV